MLDYNEIFLNEAAWPTKAYQDAEFRESTRDEANKYDRPKTDAPSVSQGLYPQMLQPSGSYAP